MRSVAFLRKLSQIPGLMPARKRLGRWHLCVNVAKPFVLLDQPHGKPLVLMRNAGRTLFQPCSRSQALALMRKDGVCRYWAMMSLGTGGFECLNYNRPSAP